MVALGLTGHCAPGTRAGIASTTAAVAGYTLAARITATAVHALFAGLSAARNLASNPMAHVSADVVTLSVYSHSLTDGWCDRLAQVIDVAGSSARIKYINSPDSACAVAFSCPRALLLAAAAAAAAAASAVATSEDVYQLVSVVHVTRFSYGNSAKHGRYVCLQVHAYVCIRSPRTRAPCLHLQLPDISDRAPAKSGVPTAVSCAWIGALEM